MLFQTAREGFARRALLGLAGYKDVSLAPLWCWFAAVMVAVAWLLPNHTRPWLSFHSDAWMAVALAIIAVVVLLKTRTLALSGLDVLLALTATLPLVHFGLGLIPFAGQAWVSTAYLLGFLVAVIVGRQWHRWQPLMMANIVFGSFFLASLVSVGLQLYQWMGLTEDRGILDIWVFGMAQGRPYANLGQPNQLATLLLWGLVACGWGAYRRHAGRAVVAAAAAVMLLGLALTQSRTGFFGLCAIVMCAWWWRGVWPDRRTPLYASALIPLYFVFILIIPWASSALLLEDPSSMMYRTVSEVRPALWAMIADAIAQRPWLGYGWNEVLAAHLSVAERHSDLPALFAHAHNFVLDLVVWAGLPLGLLLTLACLTWAWLAAGRLRHPVQVLYFLVLLTIGLHAMLELPLHYANFLLPTGLAIGALSGDLKIWLVGGPSRTAWRSGWLLFGGASVLVGLIIWDYFGVEAATTNFRMKAARIRSEVAPRAPDVIVLTHFPALLDNSLLEPAAGLSKEQLQRARDVTTFAINYRNLANLPILLALNGHTQEARCWMSKAIGLVAPESRPMLLQDWARFQKAHPQLQTIQWPAPGESPGVCAAVKQSRLGPWTQIGR